MTESRRRRIRRRRVVAAATAATTTLAASLVAGCAEPALRVHATSAATDEAWTRQVAPTPPPLANIRNVDLRSTILANPRIPAALGEVIRGCSMCGLGDPVYADFTKDRIDDVLVPIQGANGRAGTVALTVRAGRPQLAFAHAGSHSTVTLRAGDLVLRQQLYRGDEPACCGTGGERVTTYTWNGHRMVVRARTDGKTGAAPYDGAADVVVTP